MSSDEFHQGGTHNGKSGNSTGRERTSSHTRDDGLKLVDVHCQLNVDPRSGSMNGRTRLSFRTGPGRQRPAAVGDSVRSLRVHARRLHVVDARLTGPDGSTVPCDVESAENYQDGLAPPGATSDTASSLWYAAVASSDSGELAFRARHPAGVPAPACTNPNRDDSVDDDVPAGPWASLAAAGVDRAAESPARRAHAPPPKKVPLLHLRVDYVVAQPDEGDDFSNPGLVFFGAKRAHDGSAEREFPDGGDPATWPHCYTSGGGVAGTVGPADGTRCWTPCVDQAGCRSRWTLELCVPPGFVAVAGGDLVSVTASQAPGSDGWRVWRYDLKRPVRARDVGWAVGRFHVATGERALAGGWQRPGAVPALACVPGRATWLRPCAAQATRSAWYGVRDAFIAEGESAAGVADGPAPVPLSLEQQLQPFLLYSPHRYRQVFVERAPFADGHRAFAGLTLLSGDLLHAPGEPGAPFALQRALAQGVAAQVFGVALHVRHWSEAWLELTLRQWLTVRVLSRMMGRNEALWFGQVAQERHALRRRPAEDDDPFWDPLNEDLLDDDAEQAWDYDLAHTDGALDGGAAEGAGGGDDDVGDGTAALVGGILSELSGQDLEQLYQRPLFDPPDAHRASCSADAAWRAKARLVALAWERLVQPVVFQRAMVALFAPVTESAVAAARGAQPVAPRRWTDARHSGPTSRSTVFVGGFRRAWTCVQLLQVLAQENQGPGGSADLSVDRMANCVRAWVVARQLPPLDCGFHYDKQRNLVELVARLSLAGLRTSDVEVLGCAPPLCVRIVEFDGAFEHAIQLSEAYLLSDLPCYGHVRKNLKSGVIAARRRARDRKAKQRANGIIAGDGDPDADDDDDDNDDDDDGGAAAGTTGRKTGPTPSQRTPATPGYMSAAALAAAAGGLLAKELEDVGQTGSVFDADVVWQTRAVAELVAECGDAPLPFRWISVDPRRQLLTGLRLHQPSGCWIEQLFGEPDVLRQREALVGLRVFPELPPAVNVALHALESCRLFWRVRAEAARTLGCLASSVNQWRPLHLLLAYYRSQWFDEDTALPKSLGDQWDVTQRGLRRAVALAIANVCEGQHDVRTQRRRPLQSYLPGGGGGGGGGQPPKMYAPPAAAAFVELLLRHAECDESAAIDRSGFDEDGVPLSVINGTATAASMSEWSAGGASAAPGDANQASAAEELVGAYDEGGYDTKQILRRRKRARRSRTELQQIAAQRKLIEQGKAASEAAAAAAAAAKEQEAADDPFGIHQAQADVESAHAAAAGSGAASMLALTPGAADGWLQALVLAATRMAVRCEDRAQSRRLCLEIYRHLAMDRAVGSQGSLLSATCIRCLCWLGRRGFVPAFSTRRLRALAHWRNAAAVRSAAYDQLVVRWLRPRAVVQLHQQLRRTALRNWQSESHSEWAPEWLDDGADSISGESAAAAAGAGGGECVEDNLDQLLWFLGELAAHPSRSGERSRVHLARALAIRARAQPLQARTQGLGSSERTRANWERARSSLWALICGPLGGVSIALRTELIDLYSLVFGGASKRGGAASGVAVNVARLAPVHFAVAETSSDRARRDVEMAPPLPGAPLNPEQAARGLIGDGASRILTKNGEVSLARAMLDSDRLAEWRDKMSQMRIESTTITIPGFAVAQWHEREREIRLERKMQRQARKKAAADAERAALELQQRNEAAAAVKKEQAAIVAGTAATATASFDTATSDDAPTDAVTPAADAAATKCDKHLEKDVDTAMPEATSEPVENLNFKISLKDLLKASSGGAFVKDQAHDQQPIESTPTPASEELAPSIEIKSEPEPQSGGTTVVQVKCEPASPEPVDMQPPAAETEPATSVELKPILDKPLKIRFKLN